MAGGVELGPVCTGAENLGPTGIQSPDPSARSDYYYWLLLLVITIYHIYAGLLNCIHKKRVYVCTYISGSKRFFYVVRHLDSTASYLPTDLHLGFFRSWPSLFLPSSFSSAFLVLSFVSASTSMLFWAVFLLSFFETWPIPCELVYKLQNSIRGMPSSNIIQDNQ